VLYLYWFLAFIVISLLYIGIKLLLKAKKKEGLFKKEDLLPLGINLGVELLFSFIFCLVMALAIGGYTKVNICLYFVAIDIIVLLINPCKLLFEIKNHHLDKKHVISSSFLVLLLLLETFAFNYKTYSHTGTDTPISLTSQNSQIGGKTIGTSFSDEGIVLDAYNSAGNSQEAAFTISSLPENASNVKFTFSSSTPSAEITIYVSAKYQNDDIYYYQGKYLTDGQNVNFNIVRIDNGNYLDKVRFSFSYDKERINAPSTITITKLEFNSPINFVYSPLRLIALSLIVGFVIYCPDYIRNMKYVDSGKKPYIIIASLGVILAAIFLIYAFINKSNFFTAYPISKTDLASPSTDIYTALFDAIRKGQVYLDIDPDPKLLTVSNPYSSAIWNQYGISVLWDHAYYQGHYYCYYGILPVLLVSFPIYWLSGCTLVPNIIFLQVFAVILLVPSFLILLLEINKLVTKKVNWPLLIFLMVVGCFSAMLFSNVTFKDGYYHEGIYHTPIAYGLVSTTLFLIFAIRAYRNEEYRGLNLGLSGLFFVFIIASRPNLAMTLFLVAPLYIAILVQKGVGAKKKILEFLPLFLIIVSGAVLICYYNYARYGSIMEFGQTYQMNYDQTELTYEFNKILPTIVHFYFQGPTFYNSFPFISCSTVNLSFDNALYIRSYLGAAWVPFFWLALPLPFLFRKKDGVPLMAMSILFPLVIFFFAFTTYSLAGLCPRYLLEFYYLITLASCMSTFKLFDTFKSGDGLKNLVPITALLGILGVIVTVSLQFDTFDGFLSGDMKGLLLTLREMFNDFNV
jgi:hypothetical protein